MKKIKAQLFLISCCMLAGQNIFSQSSQIEWQNTIGGDDDDYLYSVQQTSDGGYIIGGNSSSGISGDKTENSLGLIDYWVLKLSSTGTIEWQNTIWGDLGDHLRSIQQTSDGGYILGGYSSSGILYDKTEARLGYNDYWIVKLNSEGTIEWENTIGGNDEDYLSSVQQTSDGGYILGGYSYSDISDDKTEDPIGGTDYWVVKVNSAGVIEWDNTIGGTDLDYLHSIQQTSDGGYILGGTSKSEISGDKTEDKIGGYNITKDYWVVKLNALGAVEWDNTIGGEYDDDLSSIQQTLDDGYILGGFSFSEISGDKTESSLGGYDYWVVKLNQSGTIEWQNTIGGNAADFLKAIQQTSDSGYILGGYSYSGISGDKTEDLKGESDYWVVKLNQMGNIEGQNTIGGDNYDELRSIQQTTDGGYFLGGDSFSGISGDKTEDVLGVNDYWVIKLSPDFTGINDELQENADGSTLEVYPNPFTSSTTLAFSIDEASNVTIELFDMAGRKLQTILNEHLKAGKHNLNPNWPLLPGGIYLLKMTTATTVVTRLIIIQ